MKKTLMAMLLIALFATSSSQLSQPDVTPTSEKDSNTAILVTSIHDPGQGDAG